jgi:hypothetical protein
VLESGAQDDHRCSKILPPSYSCQPQLHLDNTCISGATGYQLLSPRSPQTCGYPELGQCLLHVVLQFELDGWIQTDASFAKFLAGVTEYSKDFQLRNLRTLKLRQTSLSDSSLRPLISLCPNLRRLDLSFTLVLHPLSIFQPLDIVTVPLEKLSLTSTRVSSLDLLAIVSNAPRLKTLSLGAMGERQGSSASLGNASALTMNNETLARLTDILENFQHLETVSLVGNAKLGLNERTDGTISSFISRVGRKCQVRVN